MQKIDGDTVLTNNQAEILIFFNHIRQNLVCLGNTPAPINSVRRVRQHGRRAVDRAVRHHQHRGAERLGDERRPQRDGSVVAIR